ncbi:MAG: FHA domain-containing protein [Anaerolineae bacterium]|nr:FHA domain-containing protein [Anaerolineae bacterium]
MTKPDYSQYSAINCVPDCQLKAKNISALACSQSAAAPCLKYASPNKKQSTPGELQPTASPADRGKLQAFQKRIKHGTGYLQRVSQMAQKHLAAVIRSEPPLSGPGFEATSRVWFTLEQTKRHIMLPTSGSLVFGHGGPGVVLSPDIDLSYEDQYTRRLSRRHAIVTATKGHYTVADLGSRAGVYLNNQRVSLYPSRPLRLGDQVRLGPINFVVDRVPTELLVSPLSPQLRPVLTIVASGQRLPLTPSGSFIIGRTDVRLDYQPDIDLNSYGDLARQVSRRHARLEWKEGVPYLEDMGSSFGTRLSGNLLPIGQGTPLYPGDHMWLAGCVLAYDVELRQPGQVTDISM